MAVPVLMNEPTSLLMRSAGYNEYNYMLDRAADEPDSLKRLALIAAHSITSSSSCEKSATKPFNPLLGETFELVTDKFRFLSEQVSHHPPITATYCRGKNYTHFTNLQTMSKFMGKTLCFINQHRVFVDLEVGAQRTKERYEIVWPIISAHNLIFGNLYVDMGDRMTIRNLNNREYALIDFTRRGWFNKE